MFRAEHTLDIVVPANRLFEWREAGFGIIRGMKTTDRMPTAPRSSTFMESLAARRRFGMKPGLETIRALCAAIGDPQKRFRAVHVAGTNGKGAVCALMDAALRQGRRKREDERGAVCVGRYTSPHLVKINERFVLNGQPISDEKLEFFSQIVSSAIFQRGLSPSNSGGLSPNRGGLSPEDVTFFEALTAVAFLAFADARTDFSILECGLGGRLDATNICESELCVITRIGLDHCDWLGDTVEKIAFEKAGIIKSGVPVVLGANDEIVRTVISARAKEVGAPFFYAPDLADELEIPADIPLAGVFNRENAVTALAALRVLSSLGRLSEPDASRCFAEAVWPGRYQRIGDFIVDGAHNPPAALALARTLDAEHPGRRLPLVAGFCGDKDVVQVLRTLAPHISRGFAVRTNNPRSLSAVDAAGKMREAGIEAEPCASLSDALAGSRKGTVPGDPTLVCGSLFLAGEALLALGAYPWGDASRIDPSELLRGDSGNLV